MSPVPHWSIKEVFPVPPIPPITFMTIVLAPKNTAQNIPSAKRAGHGILPNIASKAAPIITTVISGPPIPQT